MASKIETCTEIPPDKCKPLGLCPDCTLLTTLTVPCQKYALWCWAAVAVAIDHFYRSGSTLTQCKVASMQEGAGDCCQNPCSANCNMLRLLEKVLCKVQCLDQGPIPVPATFSFSDLKTLMQPTASADLKPVCARIDWEGLGTHFVVIKGFQEKSESLVIANPFEGEHLVPFKQFKDSYFNSGIWTYYYLTDRMNHGNCI
jgi:hypothetical protein